MSVRSRKILSVGLLLAVVAAGFVALSYSSRTYEIDVDGAAVTERPRGLKILTFNAGLLDLRIFGRTVLKPADFVEERAARIPSALLELDADVIAVQEVYDSAHADSLVSTLLPHYPYYARRSTASVWIDNGLLILSKLPILEARIVTVGTGPWDEALFSAKSIMAAKLLLDAETGLTIVNIHPTSGGMVNTQDSDNIVRIRQEQIELAKRIGDSFGGELTIILGDFNAGPEIAAPNYEYLGDHGYVDAYGTFCDAVDQAPETTWDAGNQLNSAGTHSDSISQRIDHIFLSPQLSTAVDIVESRVVLKKPSVRIDDGTSVTVSDHYGVLADLRFR